MVAFLRSLARDITSLADRFWNPCAAPKPGLYTYRFQPQDGQVRIHLRIESDGSGVMFVDVTDVVHLNRTAAEFAKLPALTYLNIVNSQVGFDVVDTLSAANEDLEIVEY